MSRRIGARFGLRLLAAVSILAILAQAGYAARVPSASLQAAGRKWFAFVTGVPVSQVTLSGGSAILQNGITVLYVVKVAPKGYVLMSADRSGYPILAYSRNQAWLQAAYPPAAQDWLKFRKLEAAALIKRKLPASPAAAALWQALLSDQAPPVPGGAVPPLLATAWSEGMYFNDECPPDPRGPGGHVWAGSPAVAMGQILRRWGEPATGEGRHTYTDPVYGTRTADFGATTYDWGGMPGVLTGANAAVAQLLSQCGIAVDTKYGVSAGSSAPLSSVAPALRRYFRYSRSSFDLRKEIFPTDSDWAAMLRSELDRGRPLILAGWRPAASARAFAVDGYEHGGFFHVNWGRGGVQDGHFYLLASNEAQGYANPQEAVGAIVPASRMPEWPYWRLNREIPKQALAGVPFDIDLTAENQSALAADRGALVVTFPSFVGSQDAGNVEIIGSSSHTVYVNNQTIRRRGGFPILADHLQVEYGTSPFAAGAEDHVLLRVTPREMGPFKVLVRSTLERDGAAVSYPAAGEFLDQQGWEARRYVVEVVDSLASLVVAPAGGLTSSGPKGGPFVPDSIAYTIRNGGGGTMVWTAAKSEPWVSLSMTSGSLTPGAETTVIATINGNAGSLGVGAHALDVTFTNLTTGMGDTIRPVVLNVGGAAPEAVLTVRSAPLSGAAIVVSPTDTTGQGDGATEFRRTYAVGSSVTLTAPEQLGGQAFHAWTVDASPAQATRTITVLMDAGHRAVATFGTSRPLPFYENFDAASWPAGWTQGSDGFAESLWSVSPTKAAGKALNEMRCRNSGAEGTARLVTPALNTTGMSALILKFSHFFDPYAAGVTLKVQSSPDGVTWTDEAWSKVNPTAEIGPEAVVCRVTHNVGLPATYLAFAVAGNLDRFYGWSVDGVTVFAGTLIPPSLVAPSNGRSGLTSPVTLQWSDPNESESYYQYRIKKVGGAYEYISLPADSVSRSLPLGAGTWSWNVRSRGDEMIMTSDWANGETDWTFTVGSAVLAPPVLASPANGASGLSSPVALRWTDTNSAPQETGYKVRVRQGTGAYAYYPVASNAVTTSLPLAVGTWYWNVCATGDGATTGDSDWANAGTDWKLTVGGRLAAPDLVDPAAGATGLVTPVTLRWTDPNSSPQESCFKVRVKRGTNAYVVYTVAANQTSRTITVARGAKYSWNVRAISGNTRVPSSTWGNGGVDRTFTTK